jgi:hypothetical protein
MATTPNYGWVTPAPTDFVTDLPADFEVFADAVDADLAGLLGGTTGQVLTKDSATDHDFGWATPAGAPAKSYSLLNAGGTTLTGATTITVSGISGQDDLMILYANVSSVNANADISFRFNADGGSNYARMGMRLTSGSTYAPNNLTGGGGTGLDKWEVGKISSVASSAHYGGIRVFGANSSGVKMLQGASGSDADGGNNQQHTSQLGFWDNSATISSVSIISSTGNFDGGTLFIYGAS